MSPSLQLMLWACLAVSLTPVSSFYPLQRASVLLPASKLCIPVVKGTGMGRRYGAQSKQADFPSSHHGPVGMAQNLLPNAGVLQIRDATTGKTVCLVSTMHYNPVSIARVVNAVDKLAAENRLAAVVIESCPTRYGSWKNQSATWRRAVLMNEMHIAAERARLAGAHVVLGDQPIEELGFRVRDIFFQTLEDFASPHGWVRCATDILTAARVVMSLPPAGSAPSSSPPSDDMPQSNVFDLAILLGAPVSIVRYSLAWIIGSPQIILSAVLGCVCVWLLPDIFANALVSTSAAIDVHVRSGGSVAFDTAGGDSAMTATVLTYSLHNQVQTLTLEPGSGALETVRNVLKTCWFYFEKSSLLDRNLCWPSEEYENLESYVADAGTVLVYLAELALSARVFLVALLYERNVILARNIREACARAQGEGSVVVSVVGMAHAPGVARILGEKEVRSCGVGGA